MSNNIVVNDSVGGKTISCYNIYVGITIRIAQVQIFQRKKWKKLFTTVKCPMQNLCVLSFINK